MRACNNVDSKTLNYTFINIIEIFKEFQKYEYYRIQKFTINTSFRKQDFLTEEIKWVLFDVTELMLLSSYLFMRGTKCVR